MYIPQIAQTNQIIYVNIFLVFQKSSRLYFTKEMYCNICNTVLTVELAFLRFALTAICSMKRTHSIATQPVFSQPR